MTGPLTDYHIEFGAMCPPLIHQLEGQGLTVSDHAELMRIEVVAKAVSTVTIHGLMPRSASDRARQKLAARVWKIVRGHAARRALVSDARGDGE